MQRIVIIGGGFAGSTTASILARRLPPGWEVLLISEESYTTYNPMLSEVVGASIFPEQVVAPLRQVLGIGQRGRFVMGRVSAIDLTHRQVACATLAGERRFAYDHLVLALGNRARRDLIPGMAEHALPLKTVGDALHIRNVVLRRLAQIELETDPAMRRRLGRFVVIGGGFSGVEVAGALADCLKGIARYYPGAAAQALEVALVQNLPRLLPELPDSLGAAAQRMLVADGVDVRLGATAGSIRGDGVVLSDGELIEAATVIGTIGTQPNALTVSLGLPMERGRIRVDPGMHVAGRSDVWAIGDCACVVNARDGAASPPTAQFAVRQAAQLARNLLAAMRGQDARPFRYRPRGAMAAIGHMNGVAEVFGVRLTGLPAWLLWRAYYLSQMPTPGRKLRIFVEWTWGMFFATDITHIRFTRSIEHEDTPRAAEPGHDVSERSVAA